MKLPSRFHTLAVASVMVVACGGQSIDNAHTLVVSLASSNYRCLSGTGPSDVWAAGLGANIAHWDGTRWTEMPRPQPPSDFPIVEMAAVSPARAWAVASNTILAWDGTQWSTAWGPGVNQLVTAIVAFDANNAYAVGADSNNPASVPLALHWDGSTWTPVDVGPDPMGSLATAFGSSGSDVWLCSDRQCHHGNGATWSAVDRPMLPGSAEYGPTNVFAAAPGQYYFAAGNLFRWDGVATSVNTYAYETTLQFRLAGTPSGDLYVTGHSSVGSNGYLAHWNGSAFSRILATDNPRALDNVWASSTDNVWATNGSGSVLRMVAR